MKGKRASLQRTFYFTELFGKPGGKGTFELRSFISPFIFVGTHFKIFVGKFLIYLVRSPPKVSMTTANTVCMSSGKEDITYCSVFEINFVSKDHKWEVFWIPGAGLDEELISPTVQSLECVWLSDVKHQDTTVRTPVECHTQTLETFLASSVPDLSKEETIIQGQET